MKKNILIICLLITGSIFAQLSMKIQNKFTNLNPFSTIDIGANTNQIRLETDTDVYPHTKDGVDYYQMIIFGDKALGGVSQQLYKKFMWNMFGVVSENEKIQEFFYIFGEKNMDFEDAATVRSQTNYEQKLPLVMEYLYTNHGTNYQIARVKNFYDDKKNRVDTVIYWEKSDGKVYSFSYTRLINASVSHLPLYEYMGFKNKARFDGFIQMRNRESLPADAPSLATLTAEHKALEQQYGLLD